MGVRYTKNPNIVERRIRQEHVLVPLMSSTATLDSIYTLNEVAGEIWRRAGEGLTESEIVTALAAQYDACADALARDTHRILQELLDLGFLNAIESP